MNKEKITEIAIFHQRQMSSVHPHAIIGAIEDAIEQALKTSEIKCEVSNIENYIELLKNGLILLTKALNKKMLLTNEIEINDVVSISFRLGRIKDDIVFIENNLIEIKTKNNEKENL